MEIYEHQMWYESELSEICHIYLVRSYPENHSVMSNFEVCIVEVIIEIFF
jgi:hypothetical protein